jgi:hypothetical protein
LNEKNGPCAGLDPVVFELMTMTAGTLELPNTVRSIKAMMGQCSEREFRSEQKKLLNQIDAAWSMKRCQMPN